VRDYVVRRLDEKPTKREGGRPSNVSRDYWIAKLIAILKVEYGLSPTRRKRTGDPSGSAIVAQVLRELGIDLDETGVEAVWSKRRPRRSPSEIRHDWRMPTNVVPPEDYVTARRSARHRRRGK